MVEKSNIPRICDVSFQKAKVARPTKSAQVLINHFVHIVYKRQQSVCASVSGLAACGRKYISLQVE